MSPLILGDSVGPLRDEFVHYTSQGQVEGLRKGKWKLLVKKRRPPRQPRQNAKPAESEILLFDLKSDVGEQNNLASDHPEVVKELTARMIELDAEIENNARPPWTQ